ncbi:MAG TPA: MMPL family transporter, partial [Solirubrobacterales bacterium]|nr:MMPL family transporter [Solirubrobacterales bacterium]
MRRFAIWTTGHRKTVILGWIVALVATGMISQSVGSAFSEEFQLPDSDSKQALDLLEERFPAQSGEAAQIVFRADQGVESPAVEQKMEGVFKKVGGLPHVSEVASPYHGNGAAAVSDDGRIAYATVQFNVTGDKLDE